MDSHPKWRLRARAALEAYFRKHSLPRLTLSLIVIISGFAGFIISYTLLHHGVPAMSLRYPLAVFGAYLVFLGQLRFWVEIERVRYDPKRVAISTTPPAEKEDIPLWESRRSKDYSSWFDWIDGLGFLEGGEGCAIGCLVVIVIGLVVAAANFFFTLVMAAPELLAEVFLDAVVVTLFYRHLKTAAKEHWLGTAVRRTWKSVLITAASLALIGYLLDQFFPNSDSIGPALKNIF